MKKVLLFILCVTAVVFTSCSPKIHYVASSSYINYETYAEQGMYITEANSVGFDYMPLGSVSSVVLPGYVKSIRPSRYNGVYDDVQRTEKRNEWQPADVEDAIILVVEKAKQQGGNGIINFKIQPTTEVDGKIVRHGFLVTGMVIRK